MNSANARYPPPSAPSDDDRPDGAADSAPLLLSHTHHAAITPLVEPSKPRLVCLRCTLHIALLQRPCLLVILATRASTSFSSKVGETLALLSNLSTHYQH